MVKYKTVKAFQKEDGSFVIEPIVAIGLTEVRKFGKLSTTFEYNLYRNDNTGEWHGDVIDCDGWRNLNEDEINNIIDRYRLEEKI